MPLPEVPNRKLIHTRTLDLRVLQRDDGLWDVEGQLVDVKPFAYAMLDATRAAGEPIHDMWLRLTIDRDLLVVDAVAHMDQGAHGPCHRIEPAYGSLVGLSIGPGWNRKARERVGGARGCTHLTEMLGQMATAAMQAMWAEKEAEEVARDGHYTLSDGIIDSCHTYRRDSDYVRDFFPDQYVAPETAEAD